LKASAGNDRICETPVRYLDDLVVNNSNSYRTVIKESEEEGIQEILRLVKSSPLEEAWIYLPKKSEWIEIGKNAKKEEKNGEQYRTKAELDGECLKSLMRHQDSLVVYHFHPEVSKVLDDKIRKGYLERNSMSEQEITELRT